MGDKRIPEMVGATEKPLTLTGKRASTSLAVSQPTGPARPGAHVAGAAPRRVFLNIENITSPGKPESYQVYLNLPPGADPAEHRELYAGLLPMFGVAESTDAAGDHPATGLHYTLEITEVVRTLEAQGEWNPDEMRVTFVPKRRGGAGAAAASTPVQVGRVSLYYS